MSTVEKIRCDGILVERNKGFVLPKVPDSHEETDKLLRDAAEEGHPSIGSHLRARAGLHQTEMDEEVPRDAELAALVEKSPPERAGIVTMPAPDLVLASSSPRRKEMLEKIGLRLICHSPDIDQIGKIVVAPNEIFDLNVALRSLSPEETSQIKKDGDFPILANVARVKG